MTRSKRRKKSVVVHDAVAAASRMLRWWSPSLSPPCHILQSTTTLTLTALPGYQYGHARECNKLVSSLPKLCCFDESQISPGAVSRFTNQMIGSSPNSPARNGPPAECDQALIGHIPWPAFLAACKARVQLPSPLRKAYQLTMLRML